jgi:osmoprotectant transport system permease protein
VTYLLAHPVEILQMCLEHAAIVLAGLALACAVAIPLGIAVSRIRWLELPVLTGAGLLYVIPSLALLAVLVPLTGLGKGTAVIAQAVYSLLVVTRNTVVGLDAVPPHLREAGVGLGLTGRQRLWIVELPAALPVIIGGIRIAAVMGVGIASIAAYIGAGGLGTLVFRGIATLNNDLIVAGVLPIAAMALTFDRLLRDLERRWTAS